MQQTLMTLNLTDGFVGEKPLEIDTGLFIKAASLRSKDNGIAAVEEELKQLNMFVMSTR